MLRSRSHWLFLIPFSVLFLAFIVGPLLYSLYLSFFANRMGSMMFVGFNNYIAALNDSSFWQGFTRVLYFGIVQVTLMIVLSLLLALLLDSKYARFKSLFRLIYFLPYAVPGVVAAIMWGFLYAPTLNPILTFLGGGHSHPLNPVSSGHLLYAIVNIVLWEATGYNMTLYYAALTGIPLDLYDAAKIDGCGEIRLAFSIKLPLLRPMLIMTLVMSIIGALQLFNEPFLLSQFTPIPLSYTPNGEIYNMAFTFGNMPYAATLSIILGAITILGNVIFVVVRRSISSWQGKRVGISTQNVEVFQGREQSA